MIPESLNYVNSVLRKSVINSETYPDGMRFVEGECPEYLLLTYAVAYIVRTSAEVSLVQRTHRECLGTWTDEVLCCR